MGIQLKMVSYQLINRSQLEKGLESGSGKGLDIIIIVYTPEKPPNYVERD